MTRERTVKVTIVGDSDQLKKAFGGASQAAGGLGDALGGVAKIAGGFVLAQGLLRVPGLLMDATQAAADDEAAKQRLSQTIRNLGGDYDAQLGRVNAAITAGQKLAFTDDDVRDSYQKLATATGDSEEALRRQQLAMDLARGANIPLLQASTLLGKVTAENVEVFKRMGITIGEGASEAEALAVIQGKFGGQAEAYAKSTAGQFEQAKIRMAEVSEQLGGFLLPLVTKLGAVFIEQVVPRIEAFAAAAGPIFASIGAWIGTNVLPPLQRFADFFMLVIWPRVQEFAALAGEQLGAFIEYFNAEILPALDRLTEPFQRAVAFVVEHWPEIMLVIGPMLTNLQIVFTTVFKVVTGLIDALVKVINGDFAGAWRALGGVVTAVWDGIVRIARNSANAVIGIMNRLIEAWNRLSFNVDIPFGPSIHVGVPQIPTIPMLARGGIVTRPTLAVLGEGGPEAVVPLGRGGMAGTVVYLTVNALDPGAAADAVARVLTQLERTGRIQMITVP